MVSAGLFEEATGTLRSEGWVRVSQIENGENDILGKIPGMEKGLEGLRNWKKASFSWKGVVKGEVGEGKGIGTLLNFIPNTMRSN